MTKGRDVDQTVLVNKADRKFRISPTETTSVAAPHKKLILEHAVGHLKRITVNEAMAFLGLRDAYLEKQRELRKKWKGDDEGFNVEDAMWHKHYQGRARSAFSRAVKDWENFYEKQDLLPCAGWIHSGDKERGVEFSIWAMIHVSSRQLAVGTDKDYSRYTWHIKKHTQKAADANVQVTTDIREYLKMGHASKDVAYFLNQVLKGDIPGAPPPALGFNLKS